MTQHVRLRQVALAVRDIEDVGAKLRSSFGLGEPFHDPVVAEFGLDNSVFAVGDTFVELVSPAGGSADTAAGRHLARHGGDAGYMAIFQVLDLERSRQQVADAGVRVIWEKAYPDLVGRHLHPKDVPGSIMSLDWVDPAGSWRWAGPDWTGAVPLHGPGGLAGLTVGVVDPPAVASRWAEVLGVAVSTTEGEVGIDVDDGRQRISFTAVPTGSQEAITQVTLAQLGCASAEPCHIGGVRFAIAERAT